MNKVQIDIGKQIRKARLSLDITQTELAQRCGTQPNHISQIEHGKKIPSMGLLYKISESLGCVVKLTVVTN